MIYALAKIVKVFLFFYKNLFQSLKQLCNDGRKDSQIKLLMTMAFEHQLKSTYLEYIEIIQVLILSIFIVYFKEYFTNI